MNGRVWIFRVEFDWRDLRFGVAWSEDAVGQHLYVCCLVRFHWVRTQSRELADAMAKAVVPPPKKPRRIEHRAISITRR